MRKIFILISCAILLFCINFFNQPGQVKADTHNVSFSTTVQATLSMDVTSGDTVPFGNLTPGSPIAAPASGTIVSVETNAANGYTLGVYDGISGSDSALLHTDLSTRIPDFSHTVASPDPWDAHTGLGITLYAADGGHKEGKWGTGVTYDDANNEYAGIPETETTAHTVTGSHVGADTSSWAYKLDVDPSQKTGSYSGSMTFSATAVLS